MAKKTIKQAIREYGIEKLASDTRYSVPMLHAVSYGYKEFGGKGAREVAGKLKFCPCCERDFND